MRCAEAVGMTLAIMARGNLSSACFLKPVPFLGLKRAGTTSVVGFSPVHQLQSSTNAPDVESGKEATSPEDTVSLYRSEGLFAVVKPLDWTSQDVVSYIRGILERDARGRGAKPVKVSSRRNKSRIVRVGHGGTLDPLAGGVLVLGVGKGTKELQKYLSGSKIYTATGELGFETTTLDMDGNVTKTAPYDHVTLESIEALLPSFTGKIMQVPPIFSAIKKDGKKMYEEARKGKTAEDMKIDAREVEVYDIRLINRDKHQLPNFEIMIECGGGTFVRSLIRDIGYELNTVATTTSLTRMKQGRFTLEDSLEKDGWTADNIYAAIDKTNLARSSDNDE